ncbi:hypothetical protein OSB04_016087 [Centaurea solstitialis]|uniref:TIR domain-containing protein n=1 Tax=Centaurea solstitialis TaxID=347529 RepID=A0AA38TIF5_9ASTR|nr:hypothetical protein OSB04_016087 [Centaurea solstitialis]
MASSSTSSIHKTSFKYDVFFSFRGIDTYKDDKNLEKGKRIGKELIEAIEESRFHVIVFSKNYASSSWCLDELVKIMECQMMNTGQTVSPIFYHVEPTHVCKQSGEFGRAFAKLENDEAAKKWKEALIEATSLSGRELRTTADGHEVDFIKLVVMDISLKLPVVSANENLVGMRTRVNDVISYLNTVPDEFCMIGIWGMGGGGKTTLARAVFDQICNEFEGSSFVENVRESSTSPLLGLKSLQQQVLRDVFKRQDIFIHGVLEGKKEMKTKMHGIKVLVVLDDVDHIDQLKALAGEQIPVQGYEELSQEVVSYAAGLPLTITVLGSHLHECIRYVSLEISSEIFMKGLRKMKKLRYLRAYTKSHDGYCFSGDWEFDEVTEYVPNSLQYLLWIYYPFSSLPKTFQANNLVMIGMPDSEIVQLWEGGEKKILKKLKYLDLQNSKLKTLDLGMTPYLVQLFLNHTKLRILELWHTPVLFELRLEGCDDLVEIHIPFKCPYLMKLYLGCCKLRTLDLQATPNLKQLSLVKCVDLEELHISIECRLNLTFLSFHCPKLRSLDILGTLNLESLLIACDDLAELYTPAKWPKLRFLILCDSKLTTLDLQGAQNLEKLDRRCYKLEELLIHSICLKLESIDIMGAKLMTFKLGLTPNLKRLKLTKCSHLVELPAPEDLGLLECLEELILSECTVLRDIPNSICKMIRLERFHLRNCVAVEKLPEELGRLECLKELNVQADDAVASSKAGTLFLEWSWRLKANLKLEPLGGSEDMPFAIFRDIRCCTYTCSSFIVIGIIHLFGAFLQVYYELDEKRKSTGGKDVDISHVEQLLPFSSSGN